MKGSNFSKIKQSDISHYAILIVLIACAVGLRAALSFVNRTANDNHTEVIMLIQEEGKTPDASRCGECFHPKLYYYVVAKILNALHLSFRGVGKKQAIIVTQLINSAASLIVLLLCYSLIKQVVCLRRYRLYLFAIVALNPPLLTAGIQTSNDTFTIMFSTISYFFMYKCWKRDWNIGYCLLAALFCILANLCKPSALPVLSAFSLVLLSAFIASQRFKYLTLLTLVVLLNLVVLFFFGEYRRNYVRYGNAFVDSFGGHIVSTEKRGIRFVAREIDDWQVRQHGVVSWFDSLLSFRMLSLMRDPINPAPTEGMLPVHMTSLWTQLFARLNCTRFHFWPGKYQGKNWYDRWLYRALFVFALAPLYLFIVGLATMFKRIHISAVCSWKIAVLRNRDWLFLCMLLSSILFYMTFNLFKMNQNAMKAIYFLPGGLLPLLYCMAVGVNAIAFKRWAIGKWGRMLLEVVLMLLIVLYFVENIALFGKLAG